MQPPLHATSFNDPFNVSLASIAESASPFIDDSDLDLSGLDLQGTSSADTSRRPTPSQCSVCDASVSRIAILEPCLHPLCSACLTSALNIVGEKDMKCATCNMSVQDFKLQTVEAINTDAIPATSTPPLGRKDRSPLLPSLFETGPADPFAFFEQPQGISTPAARGSRPGENIVLRVDNVPWVSSRAPS